MTTHTVTHTVPYLFPIGSGEQESAHPTLEIEYRYSPGYTPKAPRGEYGPIDPPEGAELELITAKVIDADQMTIDAAKAFEIAEEYLASDDGYHALVAHAEATSGPDPDAAYDEWRDEGRRNADRVDGYDRDDLGPSCD